MADVVEDLNNMHKTVYPNGYPDLVPNVAKIQKSLKFSQEDMLGSQYEMPVRLAYPGGFTPALGDGTAGAFSLNDSKAGVIGKAQVKGCQLVLRDQMSYEDAGKAAGGKRSFAKGTDLFYQGMTEAGKKRLETLLLYGNVGIGTLSAYATTPTITISAATFAPGIWSGLEGTEIDVMNGTTSTVKDTSVTIVSVNVETRVITLSGTVSGATSGDVVYFKGGYAKEMSGIKVISANTGSLFNISATTYGLWKMPALAVTGALSFGTVKKAAALSVAKGLMEDVDLYCSIGGWDDIVADIVSARTIDKSEVKKVEIGHEEIVFHGQNGKIRIVSHPMVKNGDAFGICLPHWKRIGSVDFQFGAPGFNGTPWFHLSSKAGVEARMYTNQAIFSEKPGQSFSITGIVNSTAS